MRTARAKCMDLVVELEDENLPILDPLDFIFELVVRTNIREGGEVLELIFLGHGGYGAGGGQIGSDKRGTD